MKLMIMLLISAATGAVEAGWSEGKCQRLKTRFKTTFEKVEMWKKNCFVGNFLTAKKCIDDKKSLYTSFKKVAKWEKECLPPPYKFTSKDDLKTKLQAFYDDAASTEATYGPVATWDVSGVSDMSYLFSVNHAFEMDDIRWITNDFNEDISGWDTSAVTNMDGMFQGLNEFDKPLNFYTSSVTSMAQMFYGARKFNQPLNFDTSRVTEMGYMFKGASAFNQPLNFRTSEVTNMGSMFSYASAFNQPLSFDISSVTWMAGMFESNSVYPLSLSDANKLVIRCEWKGNTAWDNYYLGSVSPNGLSGLSWGTAGRCKEGRKEEGKDIYVFG